MAYIDSSKQAGWGDLYGDCFEGINQIIENNLNLKHNDKLIDSVFQKMLKSLEKANTRMDNLEEMKN